jgi:hypothetical protein
MRRRHEPDHVHGRRAGEAGRKPGIDKQMPTVNAQDDQRRDARNAEACSSADEYGRADRRARQGGRYGEESRGIQDRLLADDPPGHEQEHRCGEGETAPGPQPHAPHLGIEPGENHERKHLQAGNNGRNQGERGWVEIHG